MAYHLYPTVSILFTSIYRPREQVGCTPLEWKKTTSCTHLLWLPHFISASPLPPLPAAGSTFGMQCVLSLFSVVTRWTGQLKAQVYNQVAMYMVWWCVEMGPATQEMHWDCNVVKLLSFVHFIPWMQNYGFTCASFIFFYSGRNRCSKDDVCPRYSCIAFFFFNSRIMILSATTAQMTPLGSDCSWL